MKKIAQALLAASVAWSAQGVMADTYQYEINMPSSYSMPLYPGLNLDQLNKISVVASRNDYQYEAQLDRLTLDFTHATDLVATNFSRDGNVYRAIVNDAWVYRQVLVEVEAMGDIHHQADMRVRLYVVEQVSNLNQPGASFGPETLNANGILNDITPNPLADRVNLTVDDKRLQLRLKRNPGDVMVPPYGQEYGFVVEADWLGHGVQSFVVAAPYGPTPEMDAVALVLEPFEVMPGEVEYQLSVRFTESATIPTNTTPPMPLRDYLMRAFPGSNY